MINMIETSQLEKYNNLKRSVLQKYDEIKDVWASSRITDIGSNDLSALFIDDVNNKRDALIRESLTIGVIGEIKRGKSITINALLGQEICPVHTTPETATLIFFDYGDEITCEVVYMDGRKQKISIEEIREFTSQKFNPENKKSVQFISVKFPSPYLRNGVRIVDTPGLNDPNSTYTDLASDMIRMSDAAVFMLRYPSISASELESLRNAVNYSQKIFILLNVNPDDWASREELKRYVEDIILADADLTKHPDLAADRLRIFPFCAKWAFEGKTGIDSSALEKSLFRDFEKELEAFLTRHKGSVILARSVRWGIEFIEKIEPLLQLEIEGLENADDQKIAEKLEQIERLRSSVEEQRQKIQNDVFEDTESLLRNINERIDKFYGDYINKFWSRPKGESFSKLYKEFVAEKKEAVLDLTELVTTRTIDITAKVNDAIASITGKMMDVILVRKKIQPEADKIEIETKEFQSLASRVAVDTTLAVAACTAGGMLAGGSGIALLPFAGPLAIPIGALIGVLGTWLTQKIYLYKVMANYISEGLKWAKVGEALGYIPGYNYLTVRATIQNEKRTLRKKFSEILTDYSESLVKKIESEIAAQFDYLDRTYQEVGQLATDKGKVQEKIEILQRNKSRLFNIREDLKSIFESAKDLCE